MSQYCWIISCFLELWIIWEKPFNVLFVFMCFWTSWFWPGTRTNLPKYCKRRCCWSRAGNTQSPMRWPVLRRLPHQVCWPQKDHQATTLTAGACSGPGGVWEFFIPGIRAIMALGILLSSKCCSFFCFWAGKQMAKTGLSWEMAESIILYPCDRMLFVYQNQSLTFPQ